MITGATLLHLMYSLIPVLSIEFQPVIIDYHYHSSAYALLFLLCTAKVQSYMKS